jgi:hypothetical protein
LSAPGSARRIVYLSWPAGEISGGIKAAFQHVELLNEGGFEAVVATEDAVAPSWFHSDAQVIAVDSVGPRDLLVFPENHQPLLERFASAANPKAVFCQNPFQIWRGLSSRASYADYGATHVLCASHTTLQFCARRLPGMKLGYTPFFIDHTRFRCPPDKAMRIACIPRKRMPEASAIRDLFLAAYPQYRDIPWQVIGNASEEQVAGAMAECAVFLSLARLEAHSMTTLEAMASGCIVAGFSGVAGNSDSASAGNGFWAAEDDITGCTDRLADAVRLMVEQGGHYQAMVSQSRKTAWAWRREEAQRQLLDFWRQALAEIG